MEIFSKRFVTFIQKQVKFGFLKVARLSLWKKDGLRRLDSKCFIELKQLQWRHNGSFSLFHGILFEFFCLLFINDKSAV